MTKKEMKFKLKNKDVKQAEDKEGKEVFTFVPVEEDLAKKIKISIYQTAGSDIVEDMGLPTEIGDTVNIEIGAKNKQSKLTDDNRVQDTTKIHEPTEPGEFLDPEPKKKRGRSNAKKKKQTL
jgi:hypothetical protein